MVTEDQRDVIALLESPSTHGGAPVERIDTHASVVFMAGNRAWKMKRAVRYEFLDFSTLDRRRQMCEAELRINRRTAPALYRGVVPVTRDSGATLALDGTGEPVEWVIEMVRFEQDDLFDRLAERRALGPERMHPLVTAIVAMHATAEIVSERGGVRGINWVIDGNESAFGEPFADILDAAVCRQITAAARNEVSRRADLLESRRLSGHVRRCHGDLHLRNIVMFDGRPTPFDAIEFNDAIACIDVLYDLAFLLMDLWRRQLSTHANLVWGGYLNQTAEFDGIALMPLFLSCRAAVRAKTEAMEARMQRDARRRSELEDASREYAAMALEFLRPSQPMLIAVGGLSGSGKSTLAHALAPGLGKAPGAVVLRSDEIRKQLCGVEALDRLGPESYTADISKQVYSLLFTRAATVVRHGCVAIADAVFARPFDRDAIERAASAAGVPFVGIWLDAPESVLLARVAQRQHDASDANAEVIRSQIAADFGAISWQRIDAAAAPPDLLARVISLLRDRLPDRLGLA